MATTPPPQPRRVLGLLDANKARGQSPLTSTPGKGAIGNALIGRPVPGSAVLTQIMAVGKPGVLSPQKPATNLDAGQAGAGPKRKFTDAASGDLSPNKMRRVLDGPHEAEMQEEGDCQDEVVPKGNSEGENGLVHGERAELLQGSGDDESLSSQSSATEVVFDEAVGEDSQISVMTEPDRIAPVPTLAPSTPFEISPTPSPRIMTPQEAREKAEALRLRLQLSMYKVRTNQTDIPLSRLEIITPFRSHQPRANPYTSTSILSLSGGSHPNPLRQRPSPTRPDTTMTDAPPSSPPDSAKTARQHEQNHTRSLSGAPDSENSPVQSPSRPIVRDFATPVLPRSRDGFLNATTEDVEDMETESPMFERRGAAVNGVQDLTSSVVKGRAADGLLSLMMAGSDSGAGKR